MKILLINPSQSKAYGDMKAPVQLHMGLAYLGAAIKSKGYPVEIVDMDAESLLSEEIAEKIKLDNIDLVGITVTTPTLSSSLEIAEAIKRISSSSKLVLGGMHPSVMPKEAISHSCVDFVVKGEGERTILELIEAVALDKGFKDVRGLLFKEHNQVIENEDRELIKDLDTIPHPARGLFKNASYTYPDSLYAQTAPIVTSRGCPGRCTYCNAHSIFGRQFRARSARNVVDEIEMLVESSDIKEIHVWDDNFVTKKSRVYEIRDELKKRNIKVKFAFPNGLRADFLDKDILKVLKDMGTYSIAIGVESGSQEVLDQAKKGIKLSRITDVFKMAKAAGLETWAFFMFGLPGETEDTICKTIEFAKTLSPDIAKFHVLKPFPGTEVYQFMHNNNMLSSVDYDSYGIHTPPVHHIGDLSEQDLLRLQKRAYREFYFRPAMIIKQLLRIKSWNRLKLNVTTAIDITLMTFKR